MPKKKILSKGRLWMDIIQSGFLILVFVNITSFFCPSFSLSGFGFWCFLFRYLMIMFLMVFCLKKIDWRGKCFNKYMTGLFIVFTYSLFNISFHFIMNGVVWWPIGIVDIIFIFLTVFLTKLKNNISIVDLMILQD